MMINEGIKKSEQDGKIKSYFNQKNYEKEMKGEMKKEKKQLE